MTITPHSIEDIKRIIDNEGCVRLIPGELTIKIRTKLSEMGYCVDYKMLDGYYEVTKPMFDDGEPEPAKTITIEQLIAVVENSKVTLKICTPCSDYYARSTDWSADTLTYIDYDTFLRELKGL